MMQSYAHRRIGVVGGMGPAAGHYFAQKITQLAAVQSDQDHPVIIHLSNPQIPDRTQYLVHGGGDPVPHIVSTIEQLELLQADVICIPCNTAHAPELYARYSQKTNTPIVHMIEETLASIANEYSHVQRIAVLGTTGTVVAGSYQKAAQAFGLQVVVPASAEQEQLMCLIYDIKRRGVYPGDADTLRAVAQSVNADLHIVACTELSMLADDFRKLVDLPVIDSLEILASTALNYSPRVKNTRDAPSVSRLTTGTVTGIIA